jgi:hypothetical protein
LARGHRADDPLHADRRNFYKVKKWSGDGQRIEELLFAGSSLAKVGASLIGSPPGDRGRG